MNIKPDEKGIYILKLLSKMGKLKDDNTITITKPKIKAKGIIKDNAISMIEITASKEGLALIKEMENKIDFVTDPDLTGTNITIEDLKTEDFDNLFFNRTEFLKRKKSIEKLAKKVKFKSAEDSGFINKEMTILIQPIISKLTGGENNTNIDNELGYENNVYLPSKDSDNDADFKDSKGHLVGRYYRNRNTMVFFANPWKDTKAFMEYVIDRVKKVNPTLEDVEEFKLLSLSKTFTKDIYKRIKEKTDSIIGRENDIKSYQESLKRAVDLINMSKAEINGLSGMKESFTKNFFSEVTKTKKLPIIQDVDFNTTEIRVIYQPTVISCAPFKRNYNEYGKRSMYVGEVILKIRPDRLKVDNKFRIERYSTSNDPNSAVESKYPHPHARDNGDCCLGLEETKNTLAMLRSECKINDLALYFWMFVKNYGSDGGYLNPLSTMDFCLMHGYPVFDEKGKQVFINEPARIKTGEQIELKKAKDWEANVKKFKDFKPY